MLGRPIPARHALASLGHSLTRVKFSGSITPYPRYERPKKLILGGPNIWSYLSPTKGEKVIKLSKHIVRFSA